MDNFSLATEASTMNTMQINGYRAVVSFDPEIQMFRGEFLGLNGGADFYADTVVMLKKEGATSLKVFLEMCEESGIEPQKEYSGKFNLRVEPALHAEVVAEAAAEGKSLNQYIIELLELRVRTRRKLRFTGHTLVKKKTGESLSQEGLIVNAVSGQKVPVIKGRVGQIRHKKKKSGSNN